ncbi:MAG: LLM class flavin-dependent oxidoreductase [Rhizobiales bacterium]|nr:LLM class flavin-dependent oxidoreductase [Hyphomicrobiales bacterium]
MSLRIGVSIPQSGDQVLDIARLRRFVIRAEELGFDSLWVAEQIFGPGPRLDALGLLTYAAALTSRVRLVSGILLSALRNPVLLAKSIATLDHLSGGRTVVGVGLSGDRDVYPAMGYRPEDRGKRFEAGIRLIRRAWTEPSLSDENEFWSIKEEKLEPKPLQKPHPPIWFGGSNPKALARAVALGDGWIGAGAAPPARFVVECEQLQGELQKAGRDPSTFTIAKRLYVAVSDDGALALTRARQWFSTTYHGRDPAMAGDVCIVGTPDACAEQIHRLVKGRVTHLALSPVFDEVEQLEVLGRELMPRLRQLTGNQ